MTVTLRPFHDDDARAVAELRAESVRVLGARRYSAEQLAAWSPAVASAESVLARARDGRTTLVAVDEDGALLGYADLEADGHVDHLYCHPRAAGTGVADALVAALVDAARDAGIGRLFVEASELARGLFARHGFATLRRRDFDLRGVAIHNYAMERALRAGTASARADRP